MGMVFKREAALVRARPLRRRIHIDEFHHVYEDAIGCTNIINQ